MFAWIRTELSRHDFVRNNQPFLAALKADDRNPRRRGKPKSTYRWMLLRMAVGAQNFDVSLVSDQLWMCCIGKTMMTVQAVDFATPFARSDFSLSLFNHTIRFAASPYSVHRIA